jgi:hypothetical protein
VKDKFCVSRLVSLEPGRPIASSGRRADFSQEARTSSDHLLEIPAERRALEVVAPVRGATEDRDVNSGITKTLLPAGALIVPENDEIGAHPPDRPQEIRRHSHEHFIDGAQGSDQPLAFPLRVQGGSALEALDTLVAGDDDADANTFAALASSQSQAAPPCKIKQK